jgi:hypothetical protein
MIVLDANILIRAVLGRRVHQLITPGSAQGVRFFAPDVAFDDAERWLPILLEKRGLPAADVPDTLAYLRQMIEPVFAETYSQFEADAPGAASWPR